MSTGLINIAGVIITHVAQNLAVLSEVCPPVGGFPCPLPTPINRPVAAPHCDHSSETVFIQPNKGTPIISLSLVQVHKGFIYTIKISRTVDLLVLPIAL